MCVCVKLDPDGVPAVGPRTQLSQASPLQQQRGVQSDAWSFLHTITHIEMFQHHTHTVSPECKADAASERSATHLPHTLVLSQQLGPPPLTLLHLQLFPRQRVTVIVAGQQTEVTVLLRVKIKTWQLCGRERDEGFSVRGSDSQQSAFTSSINFTLVYTLDVFGIVLKCRKKINQ